MTKAELDLQDKYDRQKAHLERLEISAENASRTHSGQHSEYFMPAIHHARHELKIMEMQIKAMSTSAQKGAE